MLNARRLVDVSIQFNAVQTLFCPLNVAHSGDRAVLRETERLDCSNLSAGAAMSDSLKGSFFNLTFKYYDLKKKCLHLPKGRFSAEVNYPAKPLDFIALLFKMLRHVLSESHGLRRV